MSFFSRIFGGDDDATPVEREIPPRSESPKEVAPPREEQASVDSLTPVAGEAAAARADALPTEVVSEDVVPEVESGADAPERAASLDAASLKEGSATAKNSQSSDAVESAQLGAAAESSGSVERSTFSGLGNGAAKTPDSGRGPVARVSRKGTEVKSRQGAGFSLKAAITKRRTPLTDTTSGSRAAASPDSAPTAAAFTIRDDESRPDAVAEAVAVGQLRSFFLELHLGPLSPSWLKSAEQAAKVVSRSARANGNEELALAASHLERTAAQPRAALGRVDGEERKELLRRYAECSKAARSPFALDALLERRGRVLLATLLDGLPGLQAPTRRKLLDKQLSELEQLRSFTPTTLSAYAAVSMEDAEAILHAVRQLSERAAPRAGSWSKADNSPQVAQRLAALERAETEFADASELDDVVARRRAREARSAALLELRFAIARLGELELLDDVEKGTTRTKLERVRRWLSQGQHEAITTEK